MSFSANATPEPDPDWAEPTPRDISVADMIEAYKRWGVPHFQRGSVWGPSNVAALLESLYYDTPCGTVILWTPEKIDQHGVPFVEGNAMTHLIVDGQQRTRSVYAAFKGLFETAEGAAEEMDEGAAADGDEGTEHYWAINLNEVTEFDGVLHRPAKRAWPMFVAIPIRLGPRNDAQRERENQEPRKSVGTFPSRHSSTTLRHSASSMSPISRRS